ncbi:hypothetical protein GOB34_11660 [Sinorhizobium meliloti]|nr:hypothetical protein [Sinorhizobium meliloti]MDW9395735.1 hypothetical protein [Sinorhizobium meliloti]
MRATKLTGPRSYLFLLKSKYNHRRAVCRPEFCRPFSSDSAAGVMREILQRIEAGRRDCAQVRR